MSTLPPLLDSMAASMKSMAEHQRVISENIANSETPGFKARTVEGPDFSSLVAQYGEGAGTPHVARPQVHLTTAQSALGATQPAGSGSIVLDSNTSETKPDGNNITIEDQLLSLGQVQADYTAMTNVYKKQIGLLKRALGQS